MCTLDGLIGENKFRVWVTILGRMSHVSFTLTLICLCSINFIYIYIILVILVGHMELNLKKTLGEQHF